MTELSKTNDLFRFISSRHTLNHTAISSCPTSQLLDARTTQGNLGQTKILLLGICCFLHWFSLKPFFLNPSVAATSGYLTL